MVNKFFIVALIGLAATTQAADLYKWTDDKGVVHYSDTPPPGHADAARLKVKTGVDTDASAAPAANATADNDPNKPKDAAKPPPQQSLERGAACEQARSNLNLLQSKYQVADASGKPLDDKTRQALTDQAKQTVADCGK